MNKHLEIETTNICNAQCIVCPHGCGTATFPQGTMDNITYWMIIDKLADAGLRVDKFAPYMSGEPLLDDKIFSRIDYAIDKLGITIIDFSTNCALLDQFVIDRLINLATRINRLYLTLTLHRPVDKQLLNTDYVFQFEHRIHNALNVMMAIYSSMISSRINIKINDFTDNTKEGFDYWQNIFNSAHVSPFKLDNNYPNSRAGNVPWVKTAVAKTWRDCWRIHDWLHFNWRGDVVLCCQDFNCNLILDNIHNIYNMKVFIEDLPKLILKKGGESNIACYRCDRIKV